MSRKGHLSVATDENPEEPPKTPWGTLILTTVVLSGVTTSVGLLITSIWTRGARYRERQRLEQDQRAIHYLIGRDIERSKQDERAAAAAPATTSNAHYGMSDLPHPMSGEYENGERWRETYERQLNHQRSTLEAQARTIEEQQRRMSESQRRYDKSMREFEKRLADIESGASDEDEEEEAEEEEKPKRRRR